MVPIKEGGTFAIRCKLCGDKYSSESTFITHAKLHTGELSFKCRLPNCAKSYSSWNNLKKHLANHCEKFRETEKGRMRGAEEPADSAVDDDDIEDLSYLCALKENDILDYHRRVSKTPTKWKELAEPIQEGRFSIKCKLCGAKCTTTGTFITHAKTHNDEETYKCKLFNCIRGYTTWYNLQVHLKSHCNRRKFQCTMCDITFEDQEGFNIHLRVKSCDGALEVTDGEEVIVIQKQNFSRIQDEDDSTQEELNAGGDVEDDDANSSETQIEGMTEEQLIEMHKKLNLLPGTWKEMLVRIQKEGVPIMMCKLCDYTTTSINDTVEFRRHAYKHTGDRPFSCKVPRCKEAFGTWKHLLFHLKTHCVIQEDGEPDTNDIDNSSNEEWTVKSLVELHKELKPDPSNWKENLERVKVNGIRKKKCKLCDFTAFDKACFEAHAEKHSEEKRLFCKVPGCTASLFGWRHLVKHFESHTTKNLVCDICGHTSKWYAAFSKHLERHKKNLTLCRALEEISNEQSDEDDGAVFEKENPSLEEIIQFHNEHPIKFNSWKKKTEIVEKGAFRYDYKCLECGQVNRKRGHIKHLLEHSGEKPWRCMVVDCGKRFEKRQRRAYHFQSHCLKNVACETCDATFVDKQALRQHSVIHRPRSFECRFCSASFYVESRLISHEKLHKPGEDILKQCELCDKKFLLTKLLRLHLKIEHGIEVILATKLQYTETILEEM